MTDVLDLPKRIASKIREDGECWVWTAGKCSGGYGTIWWNGRVAVSHRVVYEELVGPIPDGLTLDHLCRNRACVNPAHLEPVTHQENILRGEGMASRWAQRTRCKRGHLLSETLRPYPHPKARGGIAYRCYECKRERDRG